ncbi:MAG: STN domain-containing protein, partial [Rudaea sp.]|nr:STN domain-containing protein [Rudaea sp.]
MHSSEPALLTRAIRACLLTTLLLPATAALARDVEFDLQGGTIEEVLPEFARQAGVQIVAPGTPSRNGAKLARFKGSMDPHAMLERLLAGSGLAVIADDGRTITLGAAAP